MVKRLPTMPETQVRSLGQEVLLEKEMAPHSSILAWKIPWVEEPGRLQDMGSQRVRQRLSNFTHFNAKGHFQDYAASPHSTPSATSLITQILTPSVNSLV